MAIVSSARSAAGDPLDGGNFVRAAHIFDVHLVDSLHACTACGTVWPCAKVLAAAFILDLQRTDPADPDTPGNC